MDLTNRELALIADVFRLLADHVVPERALRLEVGRRLLDVLRADGLHAGADLFVWSGEENLDHLQVRRGERREHFSDRERLLFDLVRPAFVAALARSRTRAARVHPVPDDASTVDNQAIHRLTRRERDVVALVVEGLLDKEIAERLGISYTTVRTHLDRSFQKLGVTNRSRLARLVQSAQR